MLTMRLLYLLLALTAREREVVVDYYVRGLTLSEVADLHGTTKSAAGQLKQSALAKMRVALVQWQTREDA